MDTFAFSYPPDGESVDLPGEVKKIPEVIRDKVISAYELAFPGVYILVAIDRDNGLIAFYTRTRETWVSISEAKGIVLSPTGPAKGPGWVEIGSEADLHTWPPGFLYSSRYTESLNEWMRGHAMSKRGKRDPR